MILNSVNYLVIIAIYGLIIVNCDLIRNEDICGQHNGRRLYLEFGDKGILYARNITFIKNIKDNGKKIYVSNSSHDKCSLEIVTCPSCAIVVTFKSLSLPHSCDDVGMMMDSPCRCDYVWISEPPYEDLSGAPYCGLYSPVIYKTSTRTVSITLLYSKSHSHAFTIEYTSERNRLHLNGTNNLITNSVNETSGGILNSPFFPSSYPRDLGMEYIITCPLLISPCKIRVLFSDFQLASVSIIEFYDWNGQRLDVSSGARFRPPIIVSSGPSLLIRFYANGGSGLGYKAFYSYVIGNFYDKTIQPITDCGGYVENLGGAITMMNMAVEDTKTFDCVWLIRPPKNFLHMKTHMYLKVVTFAEMAGNTELIVREGPTSVLLPLEIIRHPASQVQPPKMKEHIAPVANGFHVSLRGTFGATSRVAIAYTTFGYIDCFSGSDFLCQNHRCIPSQLNCDGFDHCGDNSDEPTTCFHWDVEPKNRWHMNKANYYFPKIDRYPDLQTATLVFVASSIGLIILISALIVLLYRMGARARQQRELQSRLQTISQLLDGARIDETPPTDDPPVYEAPPGYDEVVKTQHQHESFWKKIKINPRIETRCYQTQQRSRDSEVPGSLRIFNGESSSRNQESPAFSANIVTSVPESQSPPPPYATPPETIGSSNSSIKKAATYNNGSVPKNFQTNRVRKLWRRQYSYPGSNEITSIRPSTSIDPELIGLYKNINSTNKNPSANFSSQLVNLKNAGQNMNQEYKEDSKDYEQKQVENIIKLFNEKSLCKCEGACGCAIDNTIKKDNEINNTKKNILKLLGTGKIQSQNFNLTSTTVQSILPLSSVVEKIYDIKKSTGYFRDNYLTPLSIVSSCCSPVSSNCSNSLEIISLNTVDSIAPNFTGKIKTFTSCDADSLRKNIQALDAFLERREIVVSSNNNQTRRSQSIAEMIFGSFDNSNGRINGTNQTGFFNFVRGWRSSDV